MTLDELRGWTPIGLDLDGPVPTVDWADLSGKRFAEPFFDQTVARLVHGPAGRPCVRTPLDALLALDDAPSLEPAGLVFHMARCGSTLVSRLIGCVPGTVTVVEPQPINDLMRADPARLDRAVAVRVLQLLVRALGRIRFPDERRLVLKLSSWNIRRADLFVEALPETPMLWVQRRPDEVLASLLAEPPGWLALRHHPAVASHLFGLAPESVAALDAEQFAVHALASMLRAAQDTHAWVIDHSDLPDAVPNLVAPLFGLPITADTRRHMIELAGFHAKRIEMVPYRGDPDRSLSLPAQALAHGLLDPLYRVLDKHRSEALSRRRA